MQVTQLMPPSCLETYDLSLGMNPPIRPACTYDPCLDPSNRLQCSLDLSLNRPLMGLDLKAVETRAIILDFSPIPARFN
jgi:hypothetical protein